MFYFQKQVIFQQLLLGFYHDFLQPSHVFLPPKATKSATFHPSSRAKSQNLLYRCRRLFPQPKVGFGETANYHKAFLRDDDEPPWFSMEKFTKKWFLAVKKISLPDAENSWKCWWEILSSVTDPDWLKWGLQYNKMRFRKTLQVQLTGGVGFFHMRHSSSTFLTFVCSSIQRKAGGSFFRWGKFYPGCKTKKPPWMW